MTLNCTSCSIVISSLGVHYGTQVFRDFMLDILELISDIVVRSYKIISFYLWRRR